MPRITDFPPEQLEHLNSDGGHEKQQGRFSQFLADSEPLELVCKECGSWVGRDGYNGFVFHECPECSGDLEGVQS